jgi:RNA polymerase primary sigma factor
VLFEIRLARARSGSPPVYASAWIRQAIGRVLAEKSGTIRIPSHAAAKVNQVRGVGRELVQLLGREPTPAEIAGELGCPADWVCELLRATTQPISLDKPVSEDNDGTLSDLVKDEIAECPLERVNEALRREHLRRLLTHLSCRQRHAIEMRFGLRDERPERGPTSPESPA